MPPARESSFASDVKKFSEHFKHVVIIPFSWWWTIWHFILVLTWTLMTLPLRFAVGFYEREVRKQYPWLPSIWGTMNKLFPKGINLPSITSLTAGPYKGAGPTGPDLPSFDDDADIMNSIMNGNGPGDSAPPQGGGNLDGALGDVKAAQAETEATLRS